MSPNLIEKWRRSVFTQHDERDRSEASATFFISVRRAIGQCLRIGIVGVGIWLFLQHSLTLGGMFAAGVMAGFGYRFVERAARNWGNLKETAAAYKNVKMQLAGEEFRQVSFDSSTHNAAVLVDDVSFRYLGGRDNIFRKFRLEIPPGELVLVIGGAATGKTTLSRLLVGRITPDRGRINIGDVELMRLPAEVRMSTKARRVVFELFEALRSDNRLLPPEFQARAQTDAPRAIADYIAGMTDRYAILEHRRLFAIEET